MPVGLFSEVLGFEKIGILQLLARVVEVVVMVSHDSWHTVVEDSGGVEIVLVREQFCSLLGTRKLIECLGRIWGNGFNF